MAATLTVRPADPIGRAVGTWGADLTELAKLEPDTTLLIEHLPNAEEYAAAATKSWLPVRFPMMVEGRFTPDNTYRSLRP
jgi:hypothetical protein